MLMSVIMVGGSSYMVLSLIKTAYGHIGVQRSTVYDKNFQ